MTQGVHRLPALLVSDMCVSAQSHSHVLFPTPWTVARQAPLSMGFPRQEFWSGLPFPPPGDLPDPGIKPRSPALQADSLPLSHLGSESVSHLVVFDTFSRHFLPARLLCPWNSPDKNKGVSR